jgi:hypothetical protein
MLSADLANLAAEFESYGENDVITFSGLSMQAFSILLQAYGADAAALEGQPVPLCHRLTARDLPPNVASLDLERQRAKRREQLEPAP